LRALEKKTSTAGAQLFAGAKTLTVGDGDLSFSVALARAGVDVTATTIAADLAELEALYPGVDVESHVDEMRKLGRRVGFGVDATRLRETLEGGAFYDRVVFNFPCIAVENGQDGQSPASKKIDESALNDNKKLLTDFASSALKVLKQGGELFVTHKSTPPFSWWRVLETIGAVSDKFRSLEGRGAIVFDRTSFAPYSNRKAKNKQGFPVHDALTYVFATPHLPDLVVNDHATPKSTLNATLPNTLKTKRSPDETPSSKYEPASDVDALDLENEPYLLPVDAPLLSALRAGIALRPPAKKN